MKKTYLVLLIAGLSCGCLSRAQSDSENAIDNKQLITGKPLESSDSNVADAYTSPTPNAKSEYRAQAGDQKISTYVNGNLQSTSIYRDGQLIRHLIYNTQTKELSTQIEYFYKENGDFDRQKVVRGEYYDDSEDAVLAREQTEKDLKFQYGLLNSKGIYFPFSDIVGEEVSDLANILSVADNYRDVKTEVRVDGNRKLIKLVGFNKNIRFDASTIESVTGDNPLLIREYELTLENTFPSKETYNTANGKLTKTYLYNGRRLIRVAYEFTDVENRTNSLEKRFEYSKLN